MWPWPSGGKGYSQAYDLTRCRGTDPTELDVVLRPWFLSRAVHEVISNYALSGESSLVTSAAWCRPVARTRNFMSTHARERQQPEYQNDDARHTVDPAQRIRGNYGAECSSTTAEQQPPER